MAARRDPFRDVRAARLKAAGLSLEEIGERLNVSRATAHRCVRRGLAEHVNRPLEAARQLAELELDQARRELWRLLAAPDASPRTRVEAVRTLVLVNGEYRKLLGLDPPRKQEINVITESTIDAEIRRHLEEFERRGVDPETLDELDDLEA